MKSEFIHNLTIAIWLIENSGEAGEKMYEELPNYIPDFISNHVLRLIINDEMLPETLRLLKQCIIVRDSDPFKQLLDALHTDKWTRGVPVASWLSIHETAFG